MIGASDIFVAFALRHAPVDASIRALAETIGVPHSLVQRAIERLRDARIVDAARIVSAPALAEFGVHGLKYVAPAHLGAETRGTPTAWGHPAMSDVISGGLAPVWPHPFGETRGPALVPLHPAVADLPPDSPLTTDLVLLDAIRVGGGRVAALATSRLRQRLGVPA